jgi:hypothetical protein
VIATGWLALVLPLRAPPYALSHTVIGAFGLVGVAGALAAARAAHWADREFDRRTSAAALLLLLLLGSWPLSLMPWSLWAPVIGIVLLHLGGQALHVTNQRMIFRTRPEAHSRLVGLYMHYAVGSGLGAISTTAAYAHTGAGCLLAWGCCQPIGDDVLGGDPATHGVVAA